MYHKNVISVYTYLISVFTIYYDFIVTFTDRVCDRYVRKLYNACKCCEISAIPKTPSTRSFDNNH